MHSTSVLSTDAYKFAMAQAGFPRRHETFYLCFRTGGVQYVPMDLEATVRQAMAELRAGVDGDEFARAHGYGMTDAMGAALQADDEVEIAAVPQGAWVWEREPILTITGPSFLVSWLEPTLLWLNYPIQLATALRELGGDPIPAAWLMATCDQHQRIIESAVESAGLAPVTVIREDDDYRARVAERFRGLVEVVGDPHRLFELGMRSALCLEQHRMALQACYGEGLRQTSHLALAQELGMMPVGTMGHEHVQRWGADLPAFEAMRDMRVGSPSYLLDTFDTMGVGIRAAVKVMQQRAHACAIRYDSGNKFIQYLHACEVLRELGLQPTHVLADALDRAATEHFEQLRGFTGWPAGVQIYGYGGYLVSDAMTNPLRRDRVSAVFKLSETGGRPCMKFGNETGVGKQSTPGRPVVWRRLRGTGPLGLIGQWGEPVAEDYVLLSGNPDALEQLRLCNVLPLKHVAAVPPAQRTVGLSPATEALVARLRP